ncbi:MAG TPA: hypothetical protein VJU61_06845, partial [Polyangiaceae bacterium]|nr:hypothetical protein [Polyangiaceae bacterium]
RWSQLGRDCYELKVPGIFEYYPLLSAIVPPDEEFVPKFVKHASGALTIEGLYPEPPQSPLHARPGLLESDAP